MATYSIEEAKKLLSELIDKALAGEDVRIARDGEPVVQLRAGSAPRTPRTGHRLNFLYFSRCGMTLSMPRRRFLSSS
jgi:antitoxin (DNA-binding transcriptional repressor) of toxin-antitoxin stability system